MSVNAAKESKGGVEGCCPSSVRLTDQGPSFCNDVLGSTPPTPTIGAHGWHLPCGTCASFTQDMAAVRVFSDGCAQVPENASRTMANVGRDFHCTGNVLDDGRSLKGEIGD